MQENIVVATVNEDGLVRVWSKPNKTTGRRRFMYERRFGCKGQGQLFASELEAAERQKAGLRGGDEENR